MTFFCMAWYRNSHNKRKDSLEGSLDRVLFAAQLEFPKILAPKLPQHTSQSQETERLGYDQT